MATRALPSTEGHELHASPQTGDPGSRASEQDAA